MAHVVHRSLSCLALCWRRGKCPGKIAEEKGWNHTKSESVSYHRISGESGTSCGRTLIVLSTWWQPKAVTECHAFFGVAE